MFKQNHDNQFLTPSQLPPQKFLFDRFFVGVAFIIFAFGLMMVASASIDLSEHQYGSPFHYLVKQALYLLLAFIASAAIFFVSTEQLKKVSLYLLVLAIILLFLVLMPGIGRHVNGSARWIGIGPIQLQISEFVKLCVVIYMANYLIQKKEEIQLTVLGFLKPMALIAFIGLLLLAEPDFGAFVVIVFTVLIMLFLSGVRLKYFAALMLIVLVLLALIAISSPYRLQRLTTFLNPWQYQYQAGYQLTQSLIAFGRGHWLGVGLGNSIQKMLYLPEAHTDFLFAIITEELGLAGALVVVLLYILLIGRMIMIAWRSQGVDRSYGALLVFGFAFWLAIQFIVNVGVSSGVLPTKGLTLPFMSYGGSSLVIDCLALALTLRVDYETRLANLGLRHLSDLHVAGEDGANP